MINIFIRLIYCYDDYFVVFISGQADEHHP